MIERGSHSWLKQAELGYKEQDSHSTETSFIRGNRTVEVLDKYFGKVKKVNMLLVGAGRDAEPIECPYVPYKIAAHMSGRHRDFAMTIADISPEICNDLESRTHLYTVWANFTPDFADNIKKDWFKYLADSRQFDSLVKIPEKGLVFSPYLGLAGLEKYKKYGIHKAGIPKVFGDKLKSGEIRIICGDIAKADVSGSGPFDFIEFINVSYLMRPEGQMLAMVNLSGNLKKGGKLLLNDIGGYSGTPMLEKFGGWLDEARMAELSLRKIDGFGPKASRLTFLFEKFKD